MCKAANGMLLAFFNLQKICLENFIFLKIGAFVICMHRNILKSIFQVYLLYLGVIVYFYNACILH